MKFSRFAIGAISCIVMQCCLLSPAAAQTLGTPVITDASVAGCNGTYTLSWTPISGATYYQLWVEYPGTTSYAPTHLCGKRSRRNAPRRVRRSVIITSRDVQSRGVPMVVTLITHPSGPARQAWSTPLTTTLSPGSSRWAPSSSTSSIAPLRTTSRSIVSV